MKKRAAGQRHLTLEDALRHAFVDFQIREADRARQVLLNNLWDINPGELDRWADDGGRS
jgi:hypothetical protein